MQPAFPPAPDERLQLLLPFPHAPGYDAQDFLPAASNRQALAWLDAGWPDRRLALWGSAGCGKSHLLHIWARRTGARLLTGRTLTAGVLPGLAELPENSALALDDADTVASAPLLLHLLNTARDRKLHVLLACATPPSRWMVHLPDLSSRLRAITAVEIRPPGDDLLAALLMHLLADRQLNVSQPVQHWLLNRLPRSAEALREAVATLDNASLTSGKPITRSFAARVLSPADATIPDGNEEVSMAASDPSLQTASFL